MEFGRVESDELSKVDFTLPPDHEGTTRLLKNQKSTTGTRFFIGCAKWGRKDWIGKIYPPKTKEADFLNHYAGYFNSIELNATFYKMPSEKQTTAWAKKAGKGFKFCPKFTGRITHIKRLKDVQESTERFIRGVSGFGDSLGPLLLMPHPQMGPKTFDRMEAFIASLPKETSLFVELRHEDWYNDPEVFENTFMMLERHSSGAVITDAAGRRDCLHQRLTTPEAFIRFVGNGLHPTDYTRLDSWVQRIKSWMEQGIHTVYFFMHQHEELQSPELAKYLIHQLNKHCGTSIPEPRFVNEQ